MLHSNPVSVRIPTELKNWLKAQSEANCRTLSGELIALLKAKQTEQGKEP